MADSEFSPTSVSDHAKIANAIRDRDVDLAERLSREHIRKVRDKVMTRT